MSCLSLPANHSSNSCWFRTGCRIVEQPLIRTISSMSQRPVCRSPKLMWWSKSWMRWKGMINCEKKMHVLSCLCCTTLASRHSHWISGMMKRHKAGETGEPSANSPNYFLNKNEINRITWSCANTPPLVATLCRPATEKVSPSWIPPGVRVWSHKNSLSVWSSLHHRFISVK